MKVEEPAEEAVGEQEILAPVLQRVGSGVGLAEPLAEIGDVVAERADAFARRLLADEVGDQEAEEQLALDRGEKHRRLGVGAQRREALFAQRVDGALARLTRLLASLEVAEPLEPLRLDVVLALAGPREDAITLREAQQVVGARATTADETEDLVREEGQLAVDRTMAHSL